MNVIPTKIPDVLILEPRVFGDERGFFYESYNEVELLKQAGIHDRFVQDNHSRSARHVLRGLHYQIKQTQGKLVRAVIGEIFDVAVDLRKDSAFFGEWVGVRLSAENKQQIWVPPGFAHGFLVLSEFAEVVYKTTDFYSPSDERCLLWDDPEIAIDWALDGDPPILSSKDQSGKKLREAEVFAWSRSY
ncbi:dTDP-4-dehydrorhamnose 3,5-epimerase [Leptolyngbya sp. AN03gr2]|uniref:dTDP-4-dehydrorhamnose 3,5-epimerase n=1 Tax=unclassified Leptolyngbya TaxID=2650499 RepID=UPI003D31B885